MNCDYCDELYIVFMQRSTLKIMSFRCASTRKFGRKSIVCDFIRGKLLFFLYFISFIGIQLKVPIKFNYSSKNY